MRKIAILGQNYLRRHAPCQRQTVFDLKLEPRRPKLVIMDTLAPWVSQWRPLLATKCLSERPQKSATRSIEKSATHWKFESEAQKTDWLPKNTLIAHVSRGRLESLTQTDDRRLSLPRAKALPFRTVRPHQHVCSPRMNLNQRKVEWNRKAAYFETTTFSWKLSETIFEFLQMMLHREGPCDRGKSACTTSGLLETSASWCSIGVDLLCHAYGGGHSATLRTALTIRDAAKVIQLCVKFNAQYR